MKIKLTVRQKKVLKAARLLTGRSRLRFSDITMIAGRLLGEDAEANETAYAVPLLGLNILVRDARVWNVGVARASEQPPPHHNG